MGNGEQMETIGNPENSDKAVEAEIVEDAELTEDSEKKEETEAEKNEKSEEAEKTEDSKEKDIPVDAEIVEEIPAEETVHEKHTTTTRKLRYGRAFVMELLSVLIILYILVGVIFGIAAAPNDDMYPVAAAGDLVIYYRFDKDVRSQDIIVFKTNGAERVGRVIAKSGDKVDITDEGTVKVNDNTIIEPNIHAATYRFEGYVDYPVNLENGQCFVLCDVRNGTEDSRYFGAVSKNSIKGTVITVIRRNKL